MNATAACRLGAGGLDVSFGLTDGEVYRTDQLVDANRDLSLGFEGHIAWVEVMP